MKKRAIPQPTADQTEINRAVKENLEILQGLRGGTIAQLPTTATTAEIIAKLNEIVSRLQ